MNETLRNEPDEPATTHFLGLLEHEADNPDPTVPGPQQPMMYGWKTVAT